MTQKNLLKIFTTICLIGLIGTQTGCVEKDIYDSEYNKSLLPGGTYEFGYATRSDKTLSVNYNTPGFKAFIEVYDENPVDDSNIKKTGIEPIYSAYTDENGKFEGKMYIPTSAKTVYLYTANWGFPRCVKLEGTTNGFVYNTANISSGRAATAKSAPNIFTNNEAPFDFGYMTKYKDGCFLKSLSKWGWNGEVDNAATGTNYQTITAQAGKANETLGTIAKRAQDHFAATEDKTSFLSEANVTNISVKEDGTTLDVIFLAEQAAYQNVLGYYYYKEGNAPKSRDEMFKMKKYIIFPRIFHDNDGFYALPTGATARLQFFGENYDQPASEEFPKGYVIGWFFISDGFSPSSCSIKQVSLLAAFNGMNTIFFSNDVKQSDNDYRRFVSLDDKKSGLVLLGFEDQVKLDPATEDYCDALFYIQSSKDISQGGRPEIPTDPKPEEGTETISGTLCFEDIWPSGGDYDLNDVAIEYTRVLTFDGANNITKATETFTPTQKPDAAMNDNFFAYRVSSLGKVTLPSNGLTEPETNSIVINQSAKTLKSVTVTREIEGTMNKDEFKLDFDPYIIVGGYSTKDRIEVHLPKKTPTSYANNHLNYTKDEAYYMKVDGSYPFAIDIPVLNFNLATETIKIDDDTQYPKFRSWADSYGKNDTDWYKK
ncbi:MAG: LruC domain-containing protein [Bacteroidales bacterium]|nr:LruC domain-containing protein [Bacteroidales bacterium]